MTGMAATRRPADDDAHNPFGGGDDSEDKPKVPPPNEKVDPFEPTPEERQDDMMRELEDEENGGWHDI